MCKCKNKNCGCNDGALTTPAPCPCDVISCPTPELCSETFSDCCIIHTGDTIVDIGINKGDRLCDILQKLAILITNPNCAQGTVCSSAVGFTSTVITATTLGLYWDAVSDGVGYAVDYREVTNPSWTTLPTVTTNTTTITGLTPNTQYYVRVKTICLAMQTNPCYSVTLSLKTNPA